MSDANELSRRRFLGQAVGVGAAGIAAPYVAPGNALGAPGRTGSNDKISVGVIGLGGQGRWNLGQLLKLEDVAVTTLCDVWKERLDTALEQCKKAEKPVEKTCHDYRELLDRKDIDAVLIATPPHWHALMAIDACEAGKDFYLEKPMTLSVAEGLAVHRAVKKHKRITQIGTQMHATSNYRRAVEYVRSGNLGPISFVRTFNIMNQGPEGIGNTPDCDPPAGLDWDKWLGPGPERKFNPLLAKGAYYHGSFMDYSGGWTPGMAPHIVDLPYWALDLGVPTNTSASGGRYVIRDAGDAPDLHSVIWEYPNMTMNWLTCLVNSYGFDFQGKGGIRRRLAIYFHGVNGTLACDYGALKVISEGDRMKGAEAPSKSIADSKGHHREWIDCIRTRQQALCHVGYHYKIDLAITLSNLALKIGRSVRFDPKSETIVGNAEAAKLAVPTYREPYKLPAEYL